MSVGCIVAINYAIAGLHKAYDYLFTWDFAVAEVNSIKIEKPVELSIKEYVKKEIEKSGLNWEEVNCLITNESNWDDYAYNLNTNRTSDLGLWQINSIHKKTISPKDRLDYKKATTWAINKRLHDKNWDAWYGFIYNCK